MKWICLPPSVVAVCLAAFPVVAMDADDRALRLIAQQKHDSNSIPSVARFPRNVEEFEQLFEQVKDWGRWGPNDQIGAANWITDEKRRQALTLARTGRVVSLAQPYMTASALRGKIDPFAGNGSPFEYRMNEGYTTDTYKISYHSYLHSHLDGLCHVPYRGKTYNGYSAAEVNTANGCTKLGVEHLKNGVVTRGVLIDIPRLRNVPYLEPGTAVFTEEIEAWEKRAGVKVAPGDAVFLRTGRWARWAKFGPWALSEREAGFHASVAPWLKARGVAFIGSDGGLDVLPSGVNGLAAAPLHVLAINALGIAILDSQDLETLGEEAAHLNRWEFLLMMAPLVVSGGTGSPVNSLAIF
jgi:kynurenine formamidase